MMLAFELKRKAFHCLSIIFPILYHFWSKSSIITLLFFLNLLVLSIDISRNYIPQIQEAMDKIFASIMKSHEKSGLKHLSGSSYMFLGFLLTAIFFSEEKAITSWLILIVSDSLASIIGKQYGHKLSCGKSLEGSLVFILSGLAIAIYSAKLLAWDISYYKLFFAVIITAIAEFFSAKIKTDDNLLIPLVFCISC